jgi:hypothetical protein
MKMHELFEDYRHGHSAPDAESGSPLHDVSGTYGDDIYGPDAVKHYGQGYPYSSKIISKIKTLRGKPNAGVSIYRAVPKGVRDINPGDWVTLAKEYAEEHGKDNLGGNFKILHKITSAKNLYTDGSIHEWGWYPSNTPFERQT